MFSLSPTIQNRGVAGSRKRDANCYAVQVEELLRNAGDGNTAAIRQIHNLLRLIDKETHLAREQCPLPPRSTTLQKPKLKLAPFPGAPKALDIRPLPKDKLTGRRRVPILTQATWLPFLRFKRPQSPYLSRVIRNKLQQKQRRFDIIEKCELAAEVGEAEAGWEREVKGRVVGEFEKSAWGGIGSREAGMRWWMEEGEGTEFGGGVGARRWNSANSNGNRIGNNGGGNRSESEVEEQAQGISVWAIEARKARRAVLNMVFEEQDRAKEMGAKMLEIVEREREMWESERRERKGAKKGRRGGDQGGGKHAGGSEGSMQWKPKKVDWESREEGGMTERKLRVKQNTPRKEKKEIPVQDRKTGGRKDSQIVGKAKFAAEKVEMKRETEEEMMERKLMTIQLSQRKAENAYKNAKPTF
jgi:hypothetical protein